MNSSKKISKYRHEYKYLLHPSTYYRLREVLNKVMTVDQNTGINKGYYVRSLYFDDMYDTALSEKRLGKLIRSKYRIRIYDFSDQVIKLEIKDKYEDYIQKKSCSISKNEYEMILAGDVGFLHNTRNEVKERYYYEIRNNLLQPKVIIDYFREAFILPYNQIRVTFDKDLSAALPQQDIFNREMSSIQVGQEYAIIMEVKYNNFLPGHIRSLLEMHSLTRLAISKYLIGREFILRK